MKPTQAHAGDAPAPVAQETTPEVQTYSKPQLFVLGEARDLLQGGPPGGRKEPGVRRKKVRFNRPQTGE